MMFDDVDDVVFTRSQFKQEGFWGKAKLFINAIAYTPQSKKFV